MIIHSLSATDLVFIEARRMVDEQEANTDRSEMIWAEMHESSLVSPLKKVWGKWPGDESIDEMLEALK